MSTTVFTIVILLSLLLFVSSVAIAAIWFTTKRGDDPRAARHSLARDNRLRRMRS